MIASSFASLNRHDPGVETQFQLEQASAPKKPGVNCDLPTPVAMLGVPFDKITSAETLQKIGQMIESRQPHYAATANVDFVVQASKDVELRRILTDADLVLCDGMPLVWTSRLLGNPLPERVTGSDLVPVLLAEAEKRGWRVFFLGGTQDSIYQAVCKVWDRHPRLKMVGTYSPPFQPLLEMDHEEIIRRINDAGPDILLVSFGCPKQEKWINMHYRSLHVPFSIGVGATVDFLAGTVNRAPRWMQKTGLEWIYRLSQEPKRLFKRYGTDLRIFGMTVLKQLFSQFKHSLLNRKTGKADMSLMADESVQVASVSTRLDAKAIQEQQLKWQTVNSNQLDLILDFSQCKFIDSTGVGLLIRLQKNMRDQGCQVVLAGMSDELQAALKPMCFENCMPVTMNIHAARKLIASRKEEKNAVSKLSVWDENKMLVWQGEVVAANVEEVWRLTEMHLDLCSRIGSSATISLSEVRFLDSTGVGLMVRAKKHGQKHQLAVRFTEPQPAVRNVLKMLRMENILLD
jgi:N-acetylglucosaminyldiphosphoundecaprenol N-acetyl-beta-D-mannosaminyltransferase